MVLISESYALYIMVGIVIASGVVAWYMGTFPKYDRGSFHVFISVLTGLGIFVTFLFYYNLVQLQNSDQITTAIDNVANLDSAIRDNVVQYMEKYSTVIPVYISTIDPLSHAPKMEGADPVTTATCAARYSLSYRIFTVWQQYISNSKSISDNSGYICNFLQRARSRFLRQDWEKNKIEFGRRTREMGDYLFEKAATVEEETTEAFSRTADEISRDPSFMRIITG